MTFDDAIVQLEIAAREHGIALEGLLARLQTGEISRERFVSEIRATLASVRKACRGAHT